MDGRVTGAGGDASPQAVALEIPRPTSRPAAGSRLSGPVPPSPAAGSLSGSALAGGAQEDHRDTRVRADVLRTAPHGRHGLDPVDGEMVPIREGARLAEERTAPRTGLRPRLCETPVAPGLKQPRIRR